MEEKLVVRNLTKTFTLSRKQQAIEKTQNKLKVAVNDLSFTAYDGEWLDFITACRKGLPHEQYDIIEGGIADDQVFDTVDLYFSGVYTKEQALAELREKKPNHQLCITSQRVMDEYLHFKSSQRI